MIERNLPWHSVMLSVSCEKHDEDSWSTVRELVRNGTTKRKDRWNGTKIVPFFFLLKKPTLLSKFSIYRNYLNLLGQITNIFCKKKHKYIKRMNK